MRRFLWYLVYGYAYMLIPEFTSLFLVNHSIVLYVAAFIPYFIVLVIGFIIQIILSKFTKSRLFIVALSGALMGAIGIAVEWSMLQHGWVPTTSPLIAIHQAVEQISMFLYWALLIIFAWMMSDPTYKNKLPARKYYTKYSIANLIIAVPTAFTGVYVYIVRYVWLIGCLLLLPHVWRYIKEEKHI